MCNPGVHQTKTDQKLAADLRHYHQGYAAAVRELRDRGYTVVHQGGGEVLITRTKTETI